MRYVHNSDAAKRTGDLTLKEDAIQSAREATQNPTGVIEGSAQAKMSGTAAALWNQFAEDHGSFADDQSTP